MARRATETRKQDRRDVSKARRAAGLRVMSFEVDEQETIRRLQALGLLPRSAYAGAEPSWKDVERAAAVLWISAINAEISTR